jgi:6-phosphofructokinase 1
LAVSEVDAREARMVGRTAVEYSKDESKREGSVAMQRAAGGGYEISTIFTSIKNVARETKDLAPEYIGPDGNDITQAFVDYAKPIVGPMPTVGSLAELAKK